MARSNRAWLWSIFVAVLSLVLLTALFSTGFFPVQSDETHLAWVGKQAANGLVPYGDFFSYFPPLTRNLGVTGRINNGLVETICVSA